MLTRPDRQSEIGVAALLAPLEAFMRIGVAVSGGPDSLALMLMMADWAKTAGKTAIVYTVDHGLRPEAAAEADMVAGAAARLGLPCRVLQWTGAKPHSGVQAAARTARYRLIGAAMQADGAEVLVTAHHRDDQAETLLMRMAHGSGIGGLSGMALFGTVEGVRVCRPLLGVDPAQLRALVRAAGLAAASDPSNEDDKYERVRWRRLLPALADEGLDGERLATLARRMARADAALDAVAGKALAGLAAFDAFGVATLPIAGLMDLPEEIGLRVFARVVAWAGGEQERYRLAQLETAFAGLATSTPGFAATLGGAAVLRTADAIEVFREAGRMPDMAPRALAGGSSFVWDGRFRVSSPKGGADGLRLAAAGAGITRGEVEALTGPIGRKMRALHAAPALRDSAGKLVSIGTVRLAPDIVVELVAPQFKTNPSQSGQNPGNQDARY